MAGPSVLAILVAHASGSWLADALNSVAAQAHRPMRVVLVTVGDVPVSERVLRNPDGTVTLPPSTGFAEAVRAGVTAAGGDEPYLLLLHDDVALPAGAVERLVARAEFEADVAVVGAKLVEWDEPEILQEVGGTIDRFATRRPGLEEREVDHGQYDDTSDVLYVSAACMLVRRDALLRAGGMDAGAWPLYEDVDLCWRLRSSGLRVVVESSVRARHAAALSRGMRRAAGPQLGAMGIRTLSERGRLRFMLKNYSAVSLALILPQYALRQAASLLGALVRREFWGVRGQLSAWTRVARELPRIADARRRAPRRTVGDEQILALASRQAAPARRYARVALLGRSADALLGLETRVRTVLRDPATWGAVAAAAVVLATLRQVLATPAFTLGEVRPLPTLGHALGSYVSAFRSEGLDAAAPGGPGVVILGALHSVPGLGGLAEKLVLLGPLLLSSLGAFRLGRVLGFGRPGRRWLAIAAAVNPATLVLVREGAVGGLVTWTAGVWFASEFLAPAGAGAGLVEDVRRRTRWALGWGVVGALHPPALVWLSALCLAIVAGRGDDGWTVRRLRRLALGLGAAVVLNLPWSLEWFTVRSPLIGGPAGHVPAPGRGLQGATFGSGWPLAAWTLVALLGVAFVRPSRLAAALVGAASVAWMGGATGVLPARTTLAAGGVAVLLLLVLGAKGVRDELPRFALGWRQAAVIAAGVSIVGAWWGGAIGSIADGADARTVPVVPPSSEPVGRVLWLLPVQGGILSWASEGFAQTVSDWPGTGGPAERLVVRTLELAGARRTHRAGAVLSLADVSHVVALGPGVRAGLGQQADLALEDVQGTAVVYRNESWAGEALLLPAPPRGVLTPAGLASVSRGRRAVPARSRGGSVSLDVPRSARGVLYLAVGPRRGWRIDGVGTHTAAAGVFVRAADVRGRVRAAPPRRWRRPFYPVEAGLVLALAIAWLVAVYLSSPETASTSVARVTQSPALPARWALAPALVLAGALWFVWAGPLRPAPGPFLSQAWYCPPVGEGISERLAIANPSRSALLYTVRTSVEGEPIRAGRVPGRGRLTVDVAGKGGIVESFGRPAVAGSLVATDVQAVSTCSAATGRVWMFAEGGRAATGSGPPVRTVFVLDNPFPELARVSARFFTSSETIAPPALQDVRVAPGSSVTLDPESQLEPQNTLGAELTVWQGRAVVARRMRRAGLLLWSLGQSPLHSGVLPVASTRDAATTVLAVNPGDAGGRVSLELVGETGSLPNLAFDVAAKGRQSFTLGASAADHPSLFVSVRAAPAMAVESVVVAAGRSEVSVLPPLAPAESWAIAAAEGRALVLVNPGPHPVTVRLATLGAGPRIPSVRLRAGGTARVSEGADAPFGLLVQARSGIVAAVVGTGGAAPAVPMPAPV